MIPRIYVGSTRVAVSRPGYNVFGASNTTTMAFDTNLPPVERPLHAGVLYGATINSNPTFGYGTTYSLPPFAVVTRKYAGTNSYYVSPGRGVGQNWQAPYLIYHTTTYFQIVKPNPAIVYR